MDCVVAIIIRLRCILSFTQIYRQFLVDQRIPHKYRFNAPVLLCIYISYLYTHFVNLDIVLPLSILRNLHLKLYFIDRISSSFLFCVRLIFFFFFFFFYKKEKQRYQQSVVPSRSSIFDAFNRALFFVPQLENAFNRSTTDKKANLVILVFLPGYETRALFRLLFHACHTRLT